jgi:hypothetical protein
MDSMEIIMHHLKKGDEVLFGRSHNGRAKIKIKFGPMRLLTKRIQVDETTMSQIKNAIRDRKEQRHECHGSQTGKS